MSTSDLTDLKDLLSYARSNHRFLATHHAPLLNQVNIFRNWCIVNPTYILRSIDQTQERERKYALMQLLGGEPSFALEFFNSRHGQPVTAVLEAIPPVRIDPNTVQGMEVEPSSSPSQATIGPAPVNTRPTPTQDGQQISEETWVMLLVYTAREAPVAFFQQWQNEHDVLLRQMNQNGLLDVWIESEFVPQRNRMLEGTIGEPNRAGNATLAWHSRLSPLETYLSRYDSERRGNADFAQTLRELQSRQNNSQQGSPHKVISEH